MSTPFPLEDEAQGSLEPRNNPWGHDPKPGAFAGLFHDDDYSYAAPLKNIVSMPGSAAAKGELLLSGAMHGPVDLSSDESGGLTGTASKDQSAPMADAIEADARHRLKALRPDPATTGVVLQTLHGLGEMATTMLMTAPAANPALTALTLAATEAPAAYQDELDQGVAGGTAAKIAAVRGLFSGAGATVPMVFGTSLATRLLSGAASNVAFGTVGRAADSKVLRDDGYGEMADQEQVFDRSQMLIDMVMGLGFGGLHHLLSPTGMTEMPKVAEAMQNDSTMRDAALYAEIAIKDRQSGPGIPVTPGDMNAHMAAHDRALDNLEAGEHVNVAGTGIEESTVLARGGQPNPEVSEMLHGALQEAGLYEALADHDRAKDMLDRRLSLEEQPAAQGSIAHEIPRATNLEGGDRDIEGRFAEQLGSDYEAARRQYAQIKETEGGKVINTDSARELSADYLKDRTRSAAVHEPASWLTKKLYADALAKGPKRGMVLFTAGGTGAGKSSALRVMGKLTDRAHTIFDTNMNGFDSGIKKINQALAAGKRVHIVYTFRDPIEALKEGALTRAMRQEGEHGSGRTVPIDEHLGTHIGSRDVMDRLAAHFAGDQRVKITAIDNSRGRGNAAEVPLADIPKIEGKDYTQLREKALQTLEQERAAGRISDAVYRGFRGEDRGVGAGRSDAGAGSEPQSQRAQERPDAVGPQMEKPGAGPPAPGSSFLVGRVGSSGEIVNRNAGNGRALAEHLARLDDHSAPQPIGAEGSNALFLHEVTAHEPFGAYERANQGRVEGGEHIGRQEGKKGIAYSLPERGGFTSRLLAKIPLTEVYAALKRETGDANFDESGTAAGGEFLDRFLNARGAEESAKAAKEAVAGARGEGNNSSADIAQAALTERPGMMIQSPEGASISARSALEAMNETAARTEAEAPSMFKAAVDCFMRAM